MVYPWLSLVDWLRSEITEECLRSCFLARPRERNENLKDEANKRDKVERQRKENGTLFYLLMLESAGEAVSK